MPLTRVCGWLQKIAHFKIIVHARRNVNELAIVAELRQKFVLSVMAVVIPLLLMCYGHLIDTCSLKLYESAKT
jgi:hypothetical protein